MTQLRLAVFFLACCASLLAKSNPVPFVDQPLVPAAVAPGSSGPTLTVNGTGFVVGSVVEWNGVALTTTFVSSSRLTATVPDSMVAAPGTASVTVVSPCPGGGASNPALFSVTNSTNSPAFGPPGPIAVGNGPVDVIAADFNNDGKPDLAVVTECGSDPSCSPFTSSKSIDILLGNGNGTFSTRSRLTNLSFATSAAVGDFNHDGNMDLVVISEPNCMGCAYITTYLGRGDGTFKKGKLAIPGIDGNIRGITAGDFDGDGNLDLAVTGVSEIPFVLILSGNGDGTFANNSAIFYPALGGYALAITTGDFSNDDILDLAVIFGSSTYQVFLGDGTGGFSAAAAHASDRPIPMTLYWGAPQTVAMGDFNGDGILDLAYVDSTLGSLVVQLGNGNGTFAQQSGQSVPAENANISAIDINGDGILDLAVVYAGDRLSVYLGNGDGTFQAGFSPAAGNAPSGGLGIGDFNGDGRIDLAVSNPFDNTVSILLQGPTTSTTLTSSANPVFIGQTVTFTAMVTSQSAGTPAGNVTFKLGSETVTSALSGGVATFTTTFGSSGIKLIQAFYRGDGDFLGSVSPVLQEVVVKDVSATSIASSLNPSPLGQMVTFTASVSSSPSTPPDGETVTFKDGATVLGTGTLSGGVATLSTSSLSQGKHEIHAIYPGDAKLRASASPLLKQVVD